MAITKPQTQDKSPAQFGDHRLPVRFWAKTIAITHTGCWMWVGSLNTSGHGQISIHGKPYLAHRVAYVGLIGDLPHGARLYRRCKTKECVNPDHHYHELPNGDRQLDKLHAALERSSYRAA